MVIMGMSWEPQRRLTTREFDIWRHVASGLSNIEIVGITEYSLPQVEYSVIHLYEKLSIPDGSARRVKLALMFPVDASASP